jgi:hypothetical protein
MLTLRGKWRITVAEREAAWDQRVCIGGSTNADGPHPGTVGASFDVEGEQSWRLTIEHNDGSGWRESLLRVMPLWKVFGTDIHFTVWSEDMVDNPDGDFNDLILTVRKVGPIIEVPIRPYAVRTDTFQMMPDGIFETFLGEYYMGVRVKNIWGSDFYADQLLDISQRSRDIMASQGIRVIDSWTGSELDSLGQKMNGRRIVIGPLKPFESRTVFFKVDVADARPRKHHVEFECLRWITPDPDNPERRATKNIFVSKSYYDAVNKEMVAECPQGKLRMKLRRVLIDKRSARRALRRIMKEPQRPRLDMDELKSVLRAVESGRKIDLCRILKTLRCYCECGDMHGGKPGRQGRYDFDDFFIWPLEFTYTVETPPYGGTFSPIPFDDPWWKILLWIIAIILWIAALISDSEDIAYHDEDIVIGALERWQRNDVDGAVCRLNGSRLLPADTSFHYLDAQAGEFSTVPLDAMDTEIAIAGETLSNADLDDLIAAGNPDDLKVFKSGARTGLTYGMISGITHTPYTRDDDGTVFSIPQILIVEDPDQPMMVSNRGDSGSVWITQNEINGHRRIAGLNHSGRRDINRATASRIEDVMNALNIRFV